MARKRRALANNEAFLAVAIESLSTFTAHFKSLVNLLYTGKIISRAATLLSATTFRFHVQKT